MEKWLVHRNPFTDIRENQGSKDSLFLYGSPWRQGTKDPWDLKQKVLRKTSKNVSEQTTSKRKQRPDFRGTFVTDLDATSVDIEIGHHVTDRVFINDFLTYPSTYSPTDLPTYQSTYLLVYLPTSLISPFNISRVYYIPSPDRVLDLIGP